MANGTSNGKALRMLTMIDEYTRECLTIPAERALTSYEVIEQLADLFADRGTVDFIRSDDGSKFTADAVRGWLGHVCVQAAFIEPGSPWESG